MKMPTDEARMLADWLSEKAEHEKGYRAAALRRLTAHIIGQNMTKETARHFRWSIDALARKSLALEVLVWQLAVKRHRKTIQSWPEFQAFCKKCSEKQKQPTTG